MILGLNIPHFIGLPFVCPRYGKALASAIVDRLDLNALRAGMVNGFD